MLAVAFPKWMRWEQARARIFLQGFGMHAKVLSCLDRIHKALQLDGETTKHPRASPRLLRPAGDACGLLRAIFGSHWFYELAFLPEQRLQVRHRSF